MSALPRKLSPSYLPPSVVVVRTGTANLASIVAGLRRVGAAPLVTDERRLIEAADRLVLPGVGTFAAAMHALQVRDLCGVLADRLLAGCPTLAVCLGLQLFCESSDESPGVAGLGVVAGRVTRFPAAVRVPQMGWNGIAPDARCSMLTPGSAYFANSYRLVECPPGWNAAYAGHGGRFVAALQRGAVLACQFHPELSGRWGLDLLRAWLVWADGRTRTSSYLRALGGWSC